MCISPFNGHCCACICAYGPIGSGSQEVATFASGCFWGVEHIFLKHFPPKENKGILKTAVGYTGGKEDSKNPDYKTVCTGATNHAEAVRIEFDPSIVKYEELVGECTYVVHSGYGLLSRVCWDPQNSSTAPTTLRPSTAKEAIPALVRRCLASVGPFPLSHYPSSHLSCVINLLSAEYRSAIFFNTPEQEEIAKRVTEEVQKKHFDPHGVSLPLSRRLSSQLTRFLVGTKIVTQIIAAGPWWDAEDYHQLYLFKNPSGYQCPTHRLHW